MSSKQNKIAAAKKKSPKAQDQVLSKAATRTKKAPAKSKTLLEKAVVAIRAHASYHGTSRQFISKYIETEFGNNSKTALAAALKKGVANGVLSQKRQSFLVVGDELEPPAEGSSEEESDEEDFIPTSFEKNAHPELIVLCRESFGMSNDKNCEKYRVPVSRAQWAEWLSDPECERAEYGPSTDKKIYRYDDGCWTHSHFGGGRFRNYSCSDEDDSGDEGSLTSCIDCPDCYLARKIREYIEQGFKKRRWKKVK